MITRHGEARYQASLHGRHRRANLQLSVALVLAVFWTVGPAFADSYDTFLEPYRTAEINSPFRDRLDEVYVKDGQKVAAGDALADLGTRVLLAQRAMAREVAGFRGGIDSARALVKMRANRLATLQDLEKSGNAKPQEMLAAQTEQDVAQAQLQVANEAQQMKKLELAVIEAQLEEKKLRSPFAGVVVKVNRQKGELVGGNDQVPVMHIVQLDPLKAVFHLPPSLVIRFALGEELSLQSAQAPVTGAIEYISPVINAQSGTVEVRVRVSNPQQKLISGTRCSLTIDN
jgi:RND family efflux transporter MFP subunit